MKTCVICGKEIIRMPRGGIVRYNKQKTCSITCRGIHIGRLRKSKWKPKKCLFCKKDISVHYHKKIFCSDYCMRKYRIGSGSPLWKGGRKKTAGGYVDIYKPEHPFQRARYIFEHRLVVENHLIKNDPNSLLLIDIDNKKYLRPEVIIHHKNNIKDDNRISNLQPVVSQKEHFHYFFCPHCEHCKKSGELLETPSGQSAA